MHERIIREQALVMYFEEKRRLKEISQRLLVPEQTIKSWIGRYKRKYGLYGRREPLKEITEGKAKFHLLPALLPISKKQNEKRIKNPARQVMLRTEPAQLFVQFSLMYGGICHIMPPGVGAKKCTHLSICVRVSSAW